MNAQEHFWEVTQPFLARPGVTRSTMMGFPCLRLYGDFFASCDPRSEKLVIKLDADRCIQLLDRGQAEAFAPNGRRFREWVTITSTRHRSWRSLIDEALQSAATRRRHDRRTQRTPESRAGRHSEPTPRP